MSSTSATQLRRLRAEQRWLNRLIGALTLKARSPAQRTQAPYLYTSVPRIMKAASALVYDALAEIELLLAGGSPEGKVTKALLSVMQSEIEDRLKRTQLLEDLVCLLKNSRKPAKSPTRRRCLRRL